MGRGSYTDMGVIYDLLRENRIFIITPYKVYDPNNPSDARQIRFELFLSREEFETTRERLTGGRYNNAIAGKWVAGAAPFGYTYNRDTKKLEINEEEAATVRIVFDYYVNGIPDGEGGRRDVSFRALATYLSRETPLRTPKGRPSWAPLVVRQMITNERYIGTLKFRTTERINGKQVPRPEDEHIIVENAHEPIVDRETWERAQAKNTDSTHKPHNKLDFSPCELAGIIVCVKCGRRMLKQSSTQHYKSTTTGETTVYEKEFLWCKTPGCTFVKYRSVEEDLLDTLRYIGDLPDDELISRMKDLLAAEEKRKGTQSVEEMKKYAEQRTKELKHRLKFIYEKYESGVYSDDMFLERKHEIDLEMARLKNLQDSADEDSEEDKPVDPEAVRSTLKSLLALYADTNNKTDRNTILRSVFDRVEIEVIEKGRGRIPAKYIISPTLKHILI
jgi:hypothetical protein